MERHQPLTGDDAGAPAGSVSRRAFLGAALVGLTRKAPPRLEGEFVDLSTGVGHRLRDGRLEHRPRDERRVAVAVVGGGIAGLAAAWHLKRRGVDDIAVLELESRAGGNARSGENDVSPYPWAAHYVPVPDPGPTLVRELFAELGILRDGQWSERALCFSPQERLFVHGRWQEGLEPQVGPTRRDRDQRARFDEEMTAFRESGAFAVPRDRGESRQGADQVRRLDTLTMAAWLDARGFDSPWLRWQVDYACRDDYGALASDVSAWAGIHYHAARQPEEQGPLTWPEGNGWIVRRLLERIGDTVHTSSVVSRVEHTAREWVITTETVRWRAAAVVFAAPLFVLTRVLAPEAWPALRAAPAQAGTFVYSPWVTANLTLDRQPDERGFPPAWDNVLYDSPSLGYVVATHQSLRTHVPRTVWTYYWALADGAPAANRRWLLEQSWGALAGRILDDLQRAHPDIRACVSRLDIMRMGHAMIRPVVGFLGDPVRARLREGFNGLFAAHSDVSGLSLFEEAYAGGVRAADQAHAWIGGKSSR